MAGIEYNLTGEYERGSVQPYHSKPAPLYLSMGADKSDLRGIHHAIKDSITVKSPIFDTYASDFTIGFEIEKSRMDDDVLKEYALFCGFETDSSCGYEAVTHVLPLLPPSTWRTKVFDLFYQAEDVLTLPDNNSCSCHVNISSMSMRGELHRRIKPYMGIVYALWRHRLLNGYCRFDIFLDFDDNATGLGVGNRSKYRVAVDKYELIEVRLPNRVSSVKQLMRRYELFYELMRAAKMKPKFGAFLQRVKPIVTMMYEDKRKVEYILNLAKSFQKMINTRQVPEELYEFVGRPEDFTINDDSLF